jgi:uncharacterized protein (TIGR02001 family)
MTRSRLVAFSLAAAALAPSIVLADDPPKSPHTVTSNVGVFSDYRFRGLSQTMTQPALQGGFDYSHASGFYLGNWDSNVSNVLYPNASLEMDFYGGYKGSASADVSYDIGALVYHYPGSSWSPTNPQTGKSCTDCNTDNTEVYGALSWKWLTAKYSYAVSEFFGMPDTKGSTYLDLSASYDLGGGWGVNGHYGKQTVKKFDDASYADYKLGLTKDVGGYVFGLTYVSTNAKDAVYKLSDAAVNPKTMNIGKAGVVLSLSRTF